MSRSRIPLSFAALLLVCQFSTGCASFMEFLGFGFVQPEITLRDIVVRSFSVGAIKLDIKLLVKNPNNFDIKLDRLDYTVSASELLLAKGVVDKPFTIPKEGQSEVKLPLSLDPEATMRIVSMILEHPKEEIPAIVSAVALFDTPFGRIEKSFTEEKPLQKISL